MRHTILLDSRDRDYDAYPDASEYRVMLPMVYKNVEKARLISAEIPASFYVFTAEANNTTIDITLENESTPRTITIPDGNYASTTMASTLASALSQATSMAFTVSISRTTRKLTITNDEGSDFTLESSTGLPTGWGLAYYLGFDRDTAYSSTDGVLVSPRLVSLNPYNYILVDIDELNGLAEGGMYGNRVGLGSFAKIPFDGHSFDYVYVNTDNATFPEITLRPRKASIDRLHIKFRFHDGRPVDFRGVENSMMIEFVTKEKSNEDARQLVHSVSSGVSHAVGKAMVRAASTAASTAAEAATRVALTSNQSSRETDDKSKSYKTYMRYALFVSVLCVIVWYVYNKKSEGSTPT